MVDLPEPDGPTIDMKSPGKMCSETSRRANTWTCSPYTRDTWSSSRSGCRARATSSVGVSADSGPVTGSG